MQDVLSHLFLPQQSNNHRAHLLHHHSLFFVAGLLLVLQLAFSTTAKHHPEVLGTSTNISATELLALTNAQRAQNNLPPLTLNGELASAAENKAQDMFKSNYWAHYSPIGTTPWSFIKGAGYDYTYAGENLARGFTTSQDIVTAWMNSPSHRENELSPNYKDVGFAVEDGQLLGEQTTLVVEEFGSRAAADVAQAAAPSVAAPTEEITLAPTAAPQIIAKVIPTPSLTQIPTPTLFPSPDYYQNTPTSSYEQGVVATKQPTTNVLSAFTQSALVSKFQLSKSISIAILAFFILTLILDAILIERRKIVRYVGNHVDHVFFFLVILAFVLFFGGGAIL